MSNQYGHGFCEDAPCCGCCGPEHVESDFYEVQSDIDADMMAHEHRAMTEEEDPMPPLEEREDAWIDGMWEDRNELADFGGE